MCEKLFLKPKTFTAFYFIFYGYLWVGNKFGLNLVIFFQIELMLFLLISFAIVHDSLSSINQIQSVNFS